MEEEKEESQSCIATDEKLHIQKKPSRRKLWLGLGAILIMIATALVIAICLTLRQQIQRNKGSDFFVDLGYSRYSGKSFKDGTSQWLGIRYAAPPVGNLRFAAPQDLLRNTTIQQAIEVSEAPTSPTSYHTYLVCSTVPDAFQRKIISATAQFHKAEAKIVYFSTSMPLQTLEIIPQSFLFTSSSKEVASMTIQIQMMPKI